MNIIRALILCLLTIFTTQAYVELSIGPNGKVAGGDSQSYNLQPGVALEASLGKDFGSWDNRKGYTPWEFIEL